MAKKKSKAMTGQFTALGSAMLLKQEVNQKAAET